MSRRRAAVIVGAAAIGLLIAILVWPDGGGDPAAVATTTTSTGSTTTSSEPETTTTVAELVVGAVGDSLLHQVRLQLADDLDPLHLNPRSAPGLKLEDSIYYIRRLKEAGVDAMIVVLGTNDATDGRSEDDLAALGAVADELSWAPCVRWANVVTTFASHDQNVAARAIDAELVRRDEGWDAMKVVHWSEVVAGHPEYLADDGLHHSAAGQEAFSAMLAASVEDCPGA